MLYYIVQDSQTLGISPFYYKAMCIIYSAINIVRVSSIIILHYFKICIRTKPIPSGVTVGKGRAGGRQQQAHEGGGGGSPTWRDAAPGRGRRSVGRRSVGHGHVPLRPVPREGRPPWQGAGFAPPALRPVRRTLAIERGPINPRRGGGSIVGCAARPLLTPPLSSPGRRGREGRRLRSPSAFGRGGRAGRCGLRSPSAFGGGGQGEVGVVRAAAHGSGGVPRPTAIRSGRSARRLLSRRRGPKPRRAAGPRARVPGRRGGGAGGRWGACLRAGRWFPQSRPAAPGSPAIR